MSSPLWKPSINSLLLEEVGQGGVITEEISILLLAVVAVTKNSCFVGVLIEFWWLLKSNSFWISSFSFKIFSSSFDPWLIWRAAAAAGNSWLRRAEDGVSDDVANSCWSCAEIK